MSNLEKKLKRSKERLNKSLQEKRKRRDALARNLFDFPNLTLPLSLYTFFPAFAILAISSKVLKKMMAIQEFSAILVFLGFIFSFSISKIRDRWFKTYGNETILCKEIPLNKKYVAYFFLWSSLIVLSGLFVSNNVEFAIFGIVSLMGSMMMTLHEDGMLWDMPPLRVLGFKKYEFIPNRNDKHAVKGTVHHCVIRHKELFGEHYELEGTYIGKSWFLIRKRNNQS